MRAGTYCIIVDLTILANEELGKRRILKESADQEDLEGYGLG